MDAEVWDRRYAQTPLVWSETPNARFARIVTDLAAEQPFGEGRRALDLAAGEGRNALWLAEDGWSVTAVDFSAVGLEKGRTRAHAAGLEIEWVVEDATGTPLPPGSFDLVAVIYLHLEEEAMRALLARAAAAVAPGGALVVIGHDRENLVRGVGGPQDPEVLLTTALLASVTASAPDLVVRHLAQEDRETPAGTAVDTVLVARRP